MIYGKLRDGTHRVYFKLFQLILPGQCGRTIINLGSGLRDSFAGFAPGTGSLADRRAVYKVHCISC